MNPIFLFLWAFLGACGVVGFLLELGLFSVSDEQFLKNLKTVHPITYPVVLFLGGPFIWYLTTAFTAIGLVVLLFNLLFKLGKRAVKKDKND